MPLLKAPLLGFKATGSIGKKITYSGIKQGTIAKRIPTHKDAQTLAQLYVRWRFIDAKYYWRFLSQAQRDTYETNARPYHMTGWAYFLRSYLKAPPDQILWLRLDEKTGAVAQDFSGKGNHGTIFGPSPAAGKIDYCRSFDGIDDYIDSGNSTDFDLTTTLTLSAWVKLDSTHTHHHEIFVKNWGATRPYRIAIRWDTGVISFSFHDGVGWHESVSTGPIAFDIWQHISFTFSKPDVHFFINGADDGLKAFNFTFPTNTQPVYIGKDASMNTKAKGLIDEARIYNRALTPEQILEIATLELYPPPSS